MNNQNSFDRFLHLGDTAENYDMDTEMLEAIGISPDIYEKAGLLTRCPIPFSIDCLTCDESAEIMVRHDELVARLDVAQDRRHFERGGAGMCQQDFLCMEMLFHPLVALFGKKTVTCKLSELNRLRDVPKLLADDVRFVERDRVIHGDLLFPR